jgi:hypothetical protein
MWGKIKYKIKRGLLTHHSSTMVRKKEYDKTLKKNNYISSLWSELLA